MRDLVVGLGALGLVGAAPSAAAADPAWLNQPGVCTTGAFQVCLSVSDLFTVENPDGTWTLVFTVNNLGGTLGTTHTITALGFYNMGTAWTGTTTTNSVGIAGWDAVPNANSEIINNGSGFDLELGVDANGINNGIASGQSVTFTLTLTSPFVFDETTQLRWHSQAIGGGDESIKCDTGWTDDDPDSSFPPCEIVPEPVTMVLLGTGLAGLGGIGALRRRRKGREIVNG